MVEVVLTLAILVVLAAISWPAVSRPLASQRLRSAADQVRTDWTRARVKAMTCGETQVFRYAPDADRYSIECFTAAEMTLDNLAMASADMPGGATSPAARLGTERVLPEGVTFLVGDNLGVGPPVAGVGGLGDASAAAMLDPAGSPYAVFFYPDGTTSDARVALRNEYGRSIELWLRGLTGVINVGDVRTIEGRFLP